MSKSKLKSKVYAIIIKKDGIANIGDRKRKPSTDVAGEAVALFKSKNFIEETGMVEKKVVFLNNPLIHLEKGIECPIIDQKNCPFKKCVKVSTCEARYGLHGHILSYMRARSKSLFIGPCYISENNVLTDTQLYVSGSIDGSEDEKEAIRREIREEIDDNMGKNAELKIFKKKTIGTRTFTVYIAYV